MKSIKLSKYFEIVKPKYVYLKITPIKSNRNYNSDRLISLISTMYRRITDLIIKENNKLFFTVPSKIGYYIYMEKDIIGFYYIVPEKYCSLICEKLSDIWKGITIEIVTNIPMIDNADIIYYMQYEKEDALSLSTDKRSNILLSSITSTTYMLENNDSIGVLFNFIPCNQFGWKSDFDYIIQKYKDGYPIEKDKLRAKVLLKLMGKIVLEILSELISVINNILGNDKSIDKEINYSNVLELSNATYKKRDLPIINTQIAILSKSNNIDRAKYNGISVCDAFNSLNADNRLVYGYTTNTNIKIEDYRLNSIPINKTSSLECQNFLALPGKEIIEEYNINCINTIETEVPKLLQSGVINIGDNIFRGTYTTTYLCNDFELRNLPLCITGSNRSGKSTYLENLTKNCIDNGECVIAFDFCGNCEFSDKLSKLFKNNTLTIQCDDINNLQGLGYNEIKSSNDIFVQYRNAKMQSVQLATLVNAINEDDKNLKAKMDRYLEASSLVVFIQNGSINDVFKVLQDHKIRHKYMALIPKNQENNLSEYLDYLSELDEIDKKTGYIEGTQYRKIEGIIDRLNLLKKNTYIELMLKNDCSNNIDLYKEIQKNQLICIKMPENMFTTQHEKDIYCTYWYSKIWLALQLRKHDIPREHHVKVNVIVDELYQVPKCQSLISQKLSQLPKFTCKTIVSCHYLNQISELREELRACNSTYMLLQGTNVSNFDSLKMEFNNLNYTVDDLLNLKRYHSLNLVSYENGYWAGITKLPLPL